MTRGEAINWIINLTADIGKVEHRDLWHYEQALDEIRDLIQMQSESEEMLSGRVWDEWCTGCKEYDHERHCCPRFNRVIRTTLDEVTPQMIKGKWNQISPAGIYECSVCGQNVMTDDIDVYHYCHGCGAKMEDQDE